MAYKVTIDYKRGPSVSLDVDATSALAAEIIAKREAAAYGFTDPIKSVTVRAA